MIWNQWYAVLDSNELKGKNSLLGVKRLGEKLAFWRDKNGKTHCIFNVCAHRGASLSHGVVIGENIQCPFHGLEYNEYGRCMYIPSKGRNAGIPKNFKVTYYPTREEHGFIWIWWGDIHEDGNYPELPWFHNLDDSEFSYKTLIDPWKCHYSRCIENQLDVTHLWLIHKTTIGRGNNRVSDGPFVEFNNEIRTQLVWVFNRKEDGTISKLPKEVEKPKSHPFLHFKFPNLWQNMIAEKVRIFISFVPVDEDNTLLYLRFYQKFLKIPGLSSLVDRMGLFSSKIITHQDRRVVETQIPNRSEYKMKENLFPADSPIILYRRMRDELKKANNIEK